MILGITALVLMTLFGSFGMQQGGIRASMSFAGIIAGAIGAMPLAPYLNPLWNSWKIHSPWLRELLGPLSVFLVIWIVFQVISQSIHLKAEIFYKYKTSEKRLAKWERANTRLGLCVGLLNGAALFILALVPIYIFGYLTVQVASGAEDPSGMRLLNKARLELHQTKIDKVVAGYAPAKPEVYEAYDVIGLLYKNPLLESRLTRYPSFLTLAETKEFQELADDPKFHDSWQSGKSISVLLSNPKVQAIVTNAGVLTSIRQTLGPDLHDLHTFLETSKSEKYGETRVLGRWQLNYNETKNRARNAGADPKKLSAGLAAYWGATLIVTTDDRVILKRNEKAPGAENQPRNMAEGAWRKEANIYQFAFENKSSDVIFENDDRITFPHRGVTMVFDREM